VCMSPDPPITVLSSTCRLRTMMMKHSLTLYLMIQILAVDAFQTRFCDRAAVGSSLLGKGEVGRPGRTTTEQYASPTSSPPGSFSYVEGSDDWFEDDSAALEAMGGDSFFLDGSGEELGAVEGGGVELAAEPDTSEDSLDEWEWDGVDDEGAYFD
jgi:hypothetical protein